MQVQTTTTTSWLDSVPVRGLCLHRLTYGIRRSEKKSDWVWFPRPLPAFLFSPSSVAIGRLCCDSLFHLANLSQWTIPCSLPAFVARSLSLTPWELRLTMHKHISGSVRLSLQRPLPRTCNFAATATRCFISSLKTTPWTVCGSTVCQRL